MQRVTDIAALQARATKLESRTTAVEAKNDAQGTARGALDTRAATLEASMADLWRIYNESEIPPVGEPLPTYFVKNGGNDALDGLSDATAWETVAKVNGRTFSAGQSVGFKRGDTWREALILTSSGAAGNPITFTSYGAGDKPKLLGSIDMSSSANWAVSSGNVWRWAVSSGSTEICALHFDGTELQSTRKTSSTMTTQGDFYWSGGYTYLYSSSNPGTYYSGIEASKYIVGVQLGTRDYVTVKNLDLRYWGQHGMLGYVGGNNRIIEYNTIKYIGNGTASQPLGNGIELQAGTDDTVRYNRVDYCMDAALSTIPSSSGAANRSYWYRNVTTHSEYGFETQTNVAGQNQNDIRVYENVFYDNGGLATHATRPTPMGRALSSWSPSTTSTNCSFYDNISYLSTQHHTCLPTSGWICTGNRYYPGGTMWRRYNQANQTWATWQGYGYDVSGAILGAAAGDEETILAALEAML